MAVSEWCSENTGWVRIGPRRTQRLGQGVVRSPAAPAVRRPEGLEDGRDVVRGRRLAARDADVVVVDQAEEHAARRAPRRRSPAARPVSRTTTRVEELPVHEVEARALQRRGRDRDGPAVNPAGDAAQSVGPVVHRVHGGDHGEEDLRRADVRRRLLPPNVLLARLQRQAVGRALLGVDRQARPGGPAGPVPAPP